MLATSLDWVRAGGGDLTWRKDVSSVTTQHYPSNTPLVTAAGSEPEWTSTHRLDTVLRKQNSFS